MKIRHWQLGSVDGQNSILPTKEDIETFKAALQEMLDSGKDVGDFITGPEVKCTIIDIGDEKDEHISSKEQANSRT